MAGAPWQTRHSAPARARSGRGRRLSDAGGGARGPPRSTGAGEGVLSQADPRRWRCRRVTIRLTGELRPGRGDGRRGAGSGFGRQRPSTPTVVSGWERLAAVRLRSAATAAPAVADAPSAPRPSEARSSNGLRPRGFCRGTRFVLRRLAVLRRPPVGNSLHPA